MKKAEKLHLVEKINKILKSPTTKLSKVNRDSLIVIREKIENSRNTADIINTMKDIAKLFGVIELFIK